MSRIAAVAASACLALLVAACAAESSTPSEDDGVTGSTASALSTADAVARAELWAGAKLHYCQAPNHGRDYDSACSTYCNRTANASWDPYRSDCSGLVSWAWALPAPGRVTGQFAPFQTDITHAIPASQLRAGDAVNNSDHIMLFKQWIVQNTKALFIEEPGCSSAQPYAHETTSDVSINGDSIHVVENGMTFTAIRYGALTTAPAAPTDHPATGTLDGAACDTLEGWAQDKDAPGKMLDVVLDFDAASGKPGAIPVHVTASTKRPTLCATIGTACDHGFTLAMPLGARDGKAHPIFAYATDDTGKTTALLTGAPKTLTCAAPAFPMDATQGVKRHVTSQKVLGAWKLDAFIDVAREDATAVAAYAKTADLPTSPVAVQADDGSPEVWVVDGSLKRHVVDPTSLAAWQLTVTKQPAAKVAALAEGPPWPKERFAFQADGEPDVFVLDVALPAGAGGAPVIGAPDSPSGAGSDGTGGDAAPSASDGCAMSSAPHAGGTAWIALGLAALLASRRRRSPTITP
jgi:MYXO-CTERM domain-containing protein